jgi:hypothetical protein
MSAYLMGVGDTALLAAYAAYHKLTPNAARAATSLRSANNAALKARYNEPPTPLPRGFKKTMSDMAVSPEQPLSIADVSPAHILRIADTFAYQCQEGNVWETHPGCALLRKIQMHAGKG